MKIKMGEEEKMMKQLPKRKAIFLQEQVSTYEKKAKEASQAS